MIQRALVLVGREKNVRQHIREADLVTVWVLEDWSLTWTVEISRGKVLYDRRPARKPDLVFAWPCAETFFDQVEAGAAPELKFTLAAPIDLRRFSATVYQAFCRALRKVLRFPFDDEGTRLA